MTLLLGPLLVMAGSAAAAQSADAFWSLANALRPGGPFPADAAARRAAQTRGVDVLVLGSSVALRDLDEDLLSRQLGGAAVINLGVNGLPLAGIAMYTPDIVQIQPELALLVLGVMELDGKPDATWLDKYDPGVALEVYGPRRILMNLDEHLGGLLGWLNPIYRHRQGLRRLALEGPDRLGHPRRLPRLSKNQLNGQLHGLHDRYIAGRFDGTGPNPEGLRVLQRRLSLAGIPLVISPAPIYPTLAPDTSFPAPLTRLLGELGDALGLDVLPESALGRYADLDFVDPLHLGPQAQRRYTRRVGALLRERPD